MPGMSTRLLLQQAVHAPAGAKTRRTRVQGMGRDLVSLQQCAEMFRISRRTLFNLRTRGALNFVYAASAAYVKIAEMEAYLGKVVFDEFMRHWTFNDGANTYVSAK